MTLSIVLLIILALVFDFLNGFHDSANSIATIVSTRVLRPKYAVMWAAFFNFIAFLFLGLHVANTMGKGIIDIAIVDQRIILGTLVGACSWNVITWYLGLPTSSSHALIGGLDRRGAGQDGTTSSGLVGNYQNGCIHIHLADSGAFIGDGFSATSFTGLAEKPHPERLTIFSEKVSFSRPHSTA